jgi:TfoX/Sxy family transcriptional regulator of competence genes
VGFTLSQKDSNIKPILMAFNETLADRIRAVLLQKEVLFDEKRMMGGLAFIVDQKMCVGIVKDELMARIGPERYETALEIDGCHEMNFTGRAMKGYVFVEPHAVESDEKLAYWIQLALDYNPLAKASKKKS